MGSLLAAHGSEPSKQMEQVCLTVQGWLGIKHHDMLQRNGVSMDLSMGWR